MTHTETTTKTTRGGSVVKVTSMARYARSLGGEVLTDIVVTTPDGRAHSTVADTILFRRDDGLDDNYQPARWKLDGRPNHLRTVAEVVQFVADKYASNAQLILDHPEAFPGQFDKRSDYVAS